MMFVFLPLMAGVMALLYWRPLAVLGSITELLLFLYVLWYPYAAMRRYYTQGGVLTGAKYLFIGLAYGVCLVITFIGTAVITINE